MGWFSWVASWLNGGIHGHVRVMGADITLGGLLDLLMVARDPLLGAGGLWMVGLAVGLVILGLSLVLGCLEFDRGGWLCFTQQLEDERG